MKMPLRNEHAAHPATAPRSALLSTIGAGLLALAAGLLTLTAALPAAAQTYPAKPLRLIVGFAAGGLVDTLARTLHRQVDGNAQRGTPGRLGAPGRRTAGPCERPAGAL